MKICTFCGCKTDDKNRTCASCGSSTFLNVCPNCQNHFEGAFCPDCGTRYNAVAKICPNCSTKYFSKACPNCGHIDRSTANPSYGSGTRAGVSGANTNVMAGFACGLFGVMMLPIPLSIIAIVISSKEKKKGNDTPLNKAAFVLGIFGLSIGVLFAFLYIVGAVVALSR